MFKSKNVKLYFNVEGKGEYILCLHGNRDSSIVYNGLVKKLKDNFTVICPDLRGHGKSFYNGDAFTLDDMVKDLINLLDYLNIKKISVIGHSLGSTLAVLLAAQQPDRIEKLVLMSSAASFKPSFKRPLPGTKITADIIKKTNDVAANYFFTEKHEEIKKFILKGWRQIPPRMHELMLEIKHPDLNPLLKEINQPVLLICGQDDKVTPVEKSIAIKNKLVNSILITIPEAGHFVFLEEEERTLSAIIPFLNEVN